MTHNNSPYCHEPVPEVDPDEVLDRYAFPGYFDHISIDRQRGRNKNRK